MSVQLTVFNHVAMAVDLLVEKKPKETWLVISQLIKCLCKGSQNSGVLGTVPSEKHSRVGL